MIFVSLFSSSTLSGPINNNVNDPEKARKNVCPYCNVSCSKPSVLDKHIRTHTNERPYPCIPCKIAFKTQSNLYKHCRSRTHALKVEQGIDSSSVEMVAELGESFREELESERIRRDLVIEKEAQAQTQATQVLHQMPQIPQQHLVSPQVIQAVQKIQQPPAKHTSAILIRTPLEEPRDLSGKPASFQRPVSYQPQQPPQLPQRLPVMGPSISLTNSVELTTRPAPAELLQQRIDKVISENQAIVETWDPLWPRRYMRQKEANSEAIVTVEKTNKKVLYTTTNASQVTMSLVTSAPRTSNSSVTFLPASAVGPPQVPNSVMTSNVAPLSIQLATRPVMPGPTMTVVSNPTTMHPSLVVVRPASHDSRPIMDQDVLNAKSVKELWINRIAPSAASTMQRPEVGLDPRSPDGAMIKELLLKTRGATTLEPAGPRVERRDSSSSNGSSHSSNQIVLQVSKPSFDPQQMKLALPNVSLILTPTTSSVACASNLTVTSVPMPKSRALPTVIMSQAQPHPQVSDIIKVILK